MRGVRTHPGRAVVLNDEGRHVLLVSYTSEGIDGGVPEKEVVIVLKGDVGSLEDVATLQVDEPRTVNVSELAARAFKADWVRGANFVVSPALRANLPIEKVNRGLIKVGGVVTVNAGDVTPLRAN